MLSDIKLAIRLLGFLLFDIYKLYRTRFVLY